VERVGDELAVVGAGLDEEAVSLGPIWWIGFGRNSLIKIQNGHVYIYM
jgi:hypothetical protein